MALGSSIGSAVTVALAGICLSIGLADAAVILKAKKSPPAVALKADRISSLKLTLALPFDKISAIANQYDFQLPSKGVITGVPLVGTVSYAGSGRLGTIVVRASGSDEYPIEISAPFRWSGKMGKFDIVANGKVTIDFGIHAGTGWCDLIKFGEPKVDLVESKAVDIARVPFAATGIETAITGALQDQFKCERLNDALASVWHNTVVPVEVQGKTLFVNIDPQVVALTRATVEDDTIKMSASLGLAATVAAKRPAIRRQRPPPLAATGMATTSSGEVEATLSINLGLAFK